MVDLTLRARGGGLRAAALLAAAAVGSACGSGSPLEVYPPPSSSRIFLLANGVTQNVSAFFEHVPQRDCASPVASSGACGYYRACPAETTSAALDAGVLTLSSPSLSFDVPKTPQGGYLALQQPPWKTGEVLHLSATGGAAVPAFQVDLPGAVLVEIEPFVADIGGSIDRHAGVSVTWSTASPQSRLRLEFQVGNTGPGDPLTEMIACDFVAPGTSQVPASLFQQMVGDMVNVLAVSRTSTVIRPGDLVVGVDTNRWAHFTASSRNVIVGHVQLR